MTAGHRVLAIGLFATLGPTIGSIRRRLFVRLLYDDTLIPSISHTRSAELHSAVSQNCILRAADTSSAFAGFDALPITNRRYSRVQLCATGLRRRLAPKRV
jgi:hypothetical protein